MVKTRGSIQSESDSSTMAVMPANKKQRTSTSSVTSLPSTKTAPVKKTRQSKPLSKADLIKGTSHIHFHENIKMPQTQAKKKRGNNQYTKISPPKDNDQPEVVKMATGNLYIFRGSQRRVVFVRNK